MKVVVIIARFLLALVFVVFGANGFLNFIPVTTLPPGDAGQFLLALIHSHYVLGVSAVEVLGGLLLLLGRTTPLGLTVLGPVLVNICFYHIFLFRAGALPAVIATLLWFLLFYHYRQYFMPLFGQEIPAVRSPN